MTHTNTKRKHLAAFVIVLALLSWQSGYAAGNGRIVHKTLSRTGKATAPLSISYAVPAHAAVGDTVPVTVTVKVLSDVRDLNLKLTAGEGLEMPGGEFVKTYGDRGRHTAVTETATVIPRTDGIVYLNVFASGTFNGKKMTSAGAVPINTGTTVRKMLKKSGTGTTDSRGRKLIIMPAEETQPQSK